MKKYHVSYFSDQQEWADYESENTEREIFDFEMINAINNEEWTILSLIRTENDERIRYTLDQKCIEFPEMKIVSILTITKINGGINK